MQTITISEALKHWRKVRGPSQWDLTDKSGVGYARIARVETGRQEPTVGMLTRLAETLGIDVVDLFIGPKKPTGKKKRGK